MWQRLGLNRLGAIERFDLALCVERQQHPVGRRIDIEANDVSELGGKARVMRMFESAQVVCRQRRYTSTELREMPFALAMARTLRNCSRDGFLT